MFSSCPNCLFFYGSTNLKISFVLVGLLVSSLVNLHGCYSETAWFLIGQNYMLSRWLYCCAGGVLFLLLTLLEPQSRFGDNLGQTTWNLTGGVSPKKRDWSSKGVKTA